MKIQGTKYTSRLLARVIIEAATPLAVGTGEKDIQTDATVARDVNNLPYIPGSAITGVVRSMMQDTDDLFGYQRGDKGAGSKIIVSEGKIIDFSENVCDGLISSWNTENDFEKTYRTNDLEIRQHAKINGNGTAEDKGKFDEQVVYAGTRFCFEIEIVSDGSKKEWLNDVLSKVRNSSFRLGSGSRSGFGKVKVVEIKTADLDLNKEEDLKKYLNKPSNLQESASWQGWISDDIEEIKDSESWDKYELTLIPDDLFSFGSGHGDESGAHDMTTVRENVIVWENGTGSVHERAFLIPATSIKGALRHRTAYHYNLKKQHFAGDKNAKCADENEAVKALFGSNEKDNITRGNVLFSDIIRTDCKVKEKTLNHVAIDPFTGGSIEGALFTEQVDYCMNEEFTTTILMKQGMEGEYKEAFEAALKDVCTGMLPLGGGASRGLGIFSGRVKRNNEEL